MSRWFLFVLVVLFSTEAMVSSRVERISLKAMIERSDFIIIAQQSKNSKDRTLHDVLEILYVREGKKAFKDKTLGIHRGYYDHFANIEKINKEARKKGEPELLGIHMDGYEPAFTPDERYKMIYGDEQQPPMIFFLIHKETGYQQTINDGFENISQKQEVMNILEKLKNN